MISIFYTIRLTLILLVLLFLLFSLACCISCIIDNYKLVKISDNSRINENARNDIKFYSISSIIIFVGVFIIVLGMCK